jgi:hypothetical protein
VTMRSRSRIPRGLRQPATLRDSVAASLASGYRSAAASGVLGGGPTGTLGTMTPSSVPQLIAALRELQSSLRAAGASDESAAWWADKLDGPIQRLGAGDLEGAIEFRGMSGGMGSLGDLTSTMGYTGELYSRAYDLTSAVLRDFEGAA